LQGSAPACAHRSSLTGAARVGASASGTGAVWTAVCGIVLTLLTEQGLCRVGLWKRNEGMERARRTLTHCVLASYGTTPQRKRMRCEFVACRWRKNSWREN